ncbi:MAG: hypothetical protein ABI175_21795 [Polyangiales bacterium]
MTTGQRGTLSFQIAVNAGRLIEARVFGLRTLADVDGYSAALAAQVGRMATAPVLIADHRPVVIYAQAVADRLGELFLAMNSRLQRATLVAARSNATLVLQLERLVREAGVSHRKVVYTPEDAVKHLGESLDPFELQRARAFLAEYQVPP